MGVCVGDLDQRQVELLRIELAESLAANFAYSPLFDYAAHKARMRPVDQAKRDEIDEYIRSANLTTLERADVAAPEVRRFIERLFTRYLEVNPALARPRMQRRIPELRARVPRVAAEAQRALVAYAGGEGAGFGTPRQRASWAATSSRAGAATAGGERNTRVLEAVLARGRSTELSTGSPPLPSMVPRSDERRWPTEAAPDDERTEAASSWAPGATPGRVPSLSLSAPLLPSTSPFAGLEIGSQSTAFASIADRPTGPLIVDGAPAGDNGRAAGTDGQFSRSAPRELPPDLYRLYGEYLRDMQPDAPSDGSLGEPNESNKTDALDETEDPPTMVLPAVPASAAATSMTQASAPVSSQQSAVRRPTSAPPHEVRADQPIFWQLRYQLEAFVRRAASSYGIAAQSADSSGVLDTLRRSGFVDESDLRIAEGILALTDRVIGTGVATIDDFRQALTLYLLYHRSHLGD